MRRRLGRSNQEEPQARVALRETAEPGVPVAWWGLNESVQNANTLVRRAFWALTRPAGLEKRWGAWRLADIAETRRRFEETRAVLQEPDDAKWEQTCWAVVRSQIVFWHANNCVSLASDPRSDFLARRRRLALHRCASKIQAVARAYLVWSRVQYVGGRVILRGKEHHQVFGAVCLRTKRARKPCSKRAEREEKDVAFMWNRMRRVDVLWSHGCLLFVENDIDMTLGTDQGPFPDAPHVKLHFPSRVSKVTISSAPAQAKRGDLPGFQITPCIVDESGLNLWDSPEDKRRKSRAHVRQRKRSSAWIYACSTKSQHADTVEAVMHFFEDLQRAEQLDAARRSKILTWMTARADSRKYFRQDGAAPSTEALKTRRTALLKEMQQFREARAANRHLGERLCNASEDGDLAERARKAFWVLNRSRARAWGSEAVLHVDLLASFAHHHISVTRVAVVGAENCQSGEWGKLRGRMFDLESEIARKIVHACRAFLNRRALARSVRRARAQRQRFKASRERFSRRLVWRAYRESIFDRVKVAWNARIMQRAWRSVLAWRCRKADAANVLQRLVRSALARRHFADLLKLKEANDRKVAQVLSRIANRLSFAAVQRWKVFRVSHREWLAKRTAFRRKCCAKVLQRAFNALLAHRRELLESTLAKIHPSLDVLLTCFRATRDLDAFLENLQAHFEARDYDDSHFEIQERVLEERRRLAVTRAHARQPKRWDVPTPEVHWALDVVLLPFFRWPLVQVDARGQHLLTQFWRVVAALNSDFCQFASFKVARESAVIIQLRASVLAQLWHETGRCRHLVRLPSLAEEVLVLRDKTVLCEVCKALFTDPASQGRCSRCGTGRFLHEGKRPGRLVLSEEDRVDLLLLHAAFFLRISKSTRLRQQGLLCHHPQLSLTMSAREIRSKLDVEAEWWAAVELVRPWICRFKDAQVFTLEALRREAAGSLAKSWGVPDELAQALQEWIIRA